MDWGLMIDAGWKVGLLLAGLASMLWGAAVWGGRKSFVSREEFQAWLEEHSEDHEDLRERLSKGDVRFTKVEATLDHMPTKSDITALTKAVGDVTATMRGIHSDVAGMEKAMQGLRAQVQMLVENEIKGAPR